MRDTVWCILQLACWCVLPLVAGCNEDAGGGDTRPAAEAGLAPDAGGQTDAGPPAADGAPATCGPWAVPEAGGACAPVGPPCPDSARDGEGRCVPPVCPPGARPTFAGDCVARPAPTVSDACAADLAHADCPWVACPAEAAGCAPPGPPDCPAALRDAEGRCRPALARCPAGTVPLLAEGCAALTPPAAERCAERPFEAIAGDAPGVFAWSEAPADGDGSRARPFRQVAEAVARAAAEGVAQVWVGPGAYPEALHLTAPLALAAACPGSVRLTGAGATDGPAATVWVEGAEVQLEGIDLGGDGVGLRASAGGHATLVAGRVTGARLAALQAEGPGARVTARRVALLDTRAARLNDRLVGVGALALGGGAVALEHAYVGGMIGWGVLLRGAGAHRLSGVVVEGTRSNSQGLFGRGLQVADGGQLTLDASALVGNQDTGLFVFDATAEVTRSAVAETQPLGETADGTFDHRFGDGVTADGASTVGLSRIAVWGNHNSGVKSQGAGTVVTVAESLIRDTQPGYIDVRGDAGRGGEAAFGGRLEVARSALVGNHEAGLFALDAGASLQVRDSLVAETRPAAAGGGDGVVVFGGAQAELAGVRLRLNTGAGLIARGANTSVQIGASEVAETRPGADADGAGYGLAAQEGARLELTAVWARGNAGAGLYAGDEGTALVATDVVVSDTRPAGTGLYGRGINIQRGAGARLDGVSVEGSHDVGVFAHLPTAELQATELWVRDTRPEVATGLNGRGLEIQAGAASIDGLWLAGHAAEALVVSGLEAEVAVTSAAIVGGGAGDAVGTGAGAVVQQGAMRVDRSVVEGTAGYGVRAAEGGALSVTRVAALGIRAAPEPDGEGAAPGDGFAATEGATLDGETVRAEGNARAGVLWSGASGTLRRSVLRHNAYGAALQDSDEAQIDPTTVIRDNSVQDLFTDGALSTPPPPVPARL